MRHETDPCFYYVSQDGSIFLMFARRTNISYVLRGGLVFLMCKVDVYLICSTRLIIQSHCFFTSYALKAMFPFKALIPFPSPDSFALMTFRLALVGSKKSVQLPNSGKIILVVPFGTLDLLCFVTGSLSSWHPLAIKTWWI